MTQPVIQVRDLSKCYQIRSTTLKPYHSSREDFVGSLLEVGTGFHPELTGRENIFMAFQKKCVGKMG